MDEARAVVIGGGVAGASVAYHLTELGWRDVLLVDRSDLTSGSTFHSAGLVGQLRSSVTLTKMMMYAVALYRRLASETGVDPAWHEVGSLRLASSRERIEELSRLSGWGRGRRIPADRRIRRSERPHVRARRGGEAARSDDLDEHARDRDRRHERSRRERALRRARSGEDRDRRERRGYVRQPDRAPRRRRGAGGSLRAPVPVDETDRRRPHGLSDHARSRPARVLPAGGGRWAGRRRGRKASRAVGVGERASPRLQTDAASR